MHQCCAEAKIAATQAAPAALARAAMAPWLSDVGVSTTWSCPPCLAALYSYTCTLSLTVFPPLRRDATVSNSGVSTSRRCALADHRPESSRTSTPARPSRVDEPKSMPSPALPYDFTYVRIPADESESFEELTGTATTYGDALQDLLKQAFKGGSVKNADSLRAEYGSAVDERMAQLNLVASAGSVEVFALVRPASSTRPVAHAGTYFYLDEMGVLKDKPVNRRAMHFAKSCGLDVESPFLGDIYVGRVCVDPTPMHSVSFGIKEMDSGSVFIASAPSENAMYHAAMGDYEKAAKEATAKATGRVADGDDSSQDGGGSSGSSSDASLTPGQYKWAQTPSDVEVTIALPAGTGKKDFILKLTSKSIKLQLKTADEPMVELSLFARILPDESTWTLGELGGLPTISIMAEKSEEVSWSRLEAASEGKVL